MRFKTANRINPWRQKIFSWNLRADEPPEIECKMFCVQEFSSDSQEIRWTAIFRNPTQALSLPSDIWKFVPTFPSSSLLEMVLLFPSSYPSVLILNPAHLPRKPALPFQVYSNLPLLWLLGSSHTIFISYALQLKCKSLSARLRMLNISFLSSKLSGIQQSFLNPNPTSIFNLLLALIWTLKEIHEMYVSEEEKSPERE